VRRERFERTLNGRCERPWLGRRRPRDLPALCHPRRRRRRPTAHLECPHAHQGAVWHSALALRTTRSAHRRLLPPHGLPLRLRGTMRGRKRGSGRSEWRPRQGQRRSSGSLVGRDRTTRHRYLQQPTERERGRGNGRTRLALSRLDGPRRSLRLLSPLPTQPHIVSARPLHLEPPHTNPGSLRRHRHQHLQRDAADAVRSHPPSASRGGSSSRRQSTAFMLYIIKHNSEITQSVAWFFGQSIQTCTGCPGTASGSMTWAVGLEGLFGRLGAKG